MTWLFFIVLNNKMIILLFLTPPIFFQLFDNFTRQPLRLNQVLLSLCFELLDKLFLFLSNMLIQLFSCFIDWQHCRLDSLVNITLSVRGRQDHHTWEAFLRKTINAIVIVLIVHPEVKFFYQGSFKLSCRPRFHTQLDRWIVQDHMECNLENCSEKSLKIFCRDIFFEFFKSSIASTNNFLTLRLVLLL
jgi:hypothetical protein